MVARIARLFVLLLALLGAAVLVFGALFLRDGISARLEPSPIEASVARRLRALAIPRDVAARPNPVAASAEALADGMAHFADHCASCHANDGSGDTELGRSLYPRSPDMRLAPTQGLSDGALFYIIEHGVRLTGMPAWGTGSADGELSSWRLVHFIRHLPVLSAAEQLEMEALNPKSGEEWQSEEDARRFLEADGDVPPPGRPTPRPRHPH